MENYHFEDLNQFYIAIFSIAILLVCQRVYNAMSAPALSGAIDARSVEAALSVQAYHQTLLQTSQQLHGIPMVKACDWFAQSLNGNGHKIG